MLGSFRHLTPKSSLLDECQHCVAYSGADPSKRWSWLRFWQPQWHLSQVCNKTWSGLSSLWFWVVRVYIWVQNNITNVKAEQQECENNNTLARYWYWYLRRSPLFSKLADITSWTSCVEQLRADITSKWSIRIIWNGVRSSLKPELSAHRDYCPYIYVTYNIVYMRKIRESIMGPL